MSIGRADVSNAAMKVLMVVPGDEAARPRSRGFEIFESCWRELWPVLRGAEQTLDECVVVADAGPRVRRLDFQPVQHRQYRCGLERGAVVAVQYRLGLHRVNAFGQRGALDQVRCVRRVIGIVDLKAHDLAAIDIQDQVQIVVP